MGSHSGAFIFLIAVLWLVIAIYISADASKRNKSAPFWFVTTLFLGVFALLIYNISIDSHTRSRSKGGSQSQSKGADHIPWNSDSDIETQAKVGSSSHRRHPDSEKSLSGTASNWNYKIDARDYKNNRIFKISDGINEGKFVIRNGKIHPQSEVYRRKYGEQWVNKARKFLQQRYDDDAL